MKSRSSGLTAMGRFLFHVMSFLQIIIFVLDLFPLAIQAFGIMSMAESTAVVLYSIISVLHPVPAVA